MELKLTDSLLFTGFEECLDHLANELVGFFLLSDCSLYQTIFTDALKALDAACNELITDLEFLVSESNGKV